MPWLKCGCGEAAWHWCAYWQSWFSCGPSAASSMLGWVVECPVHEASWPGSQALFLPSWCVKAGYSSLVVYSLCSGPWMVTAWKTGLFCTDLLLSSLVYHWPVGTVGSRGLLDEYRWLGPSKEVFCWCRYFDSGQVKMWWPQKERVRRREGEGVAVMYDGEIVAVCFGAWIRILPWGKTENWICCVTEEGDVLSCGYSHSLNLSPVCRAIFSVLSEHIFCLMWSCHTYFNMC